MESAIFETIYIIIIMNILMNVTGLSAQPKFKEICSPQERWKKHLNIVKGNPNHVSVVIEKSPTSKIEFKKPYMLYGCNYDRFGL